MKSFYSTLSALATGGSYRFADGTAAAPSVAWGDGTTGFYRISSGVLGFAANGVAQLRFQNPGTIQSINGGCFLQLDGAGAVTIVAGTGGGANQNITLTPSGTGGVVATGLFSASTARMTVNSGRISSSGGGAPLIFEVNGSEFARLSAAGNLLLKSDGVDSGNGRIQLAAHTAVGGGVGFGPDTTLHLISPSQLALAKVSAGTVFFDFTVAGTGCARIQTDNSSANVTFGSLGGAGSLILRSGGYVTALTLDASQNATFVGQAIGSASTTARATLRVPHGTAPTAPVNGDIWTTTAGLFVRINGATVGPLT